MEALNVRRNQLEDERKQEDVSSEQRRREFSEREKQIEVSPSSHFGLPCDHLSSIGQKKLEQDIKEMRQQLAILGLSKKGYDDEMTELVRDRTELQCTIDDLKAVGERGEEKREELEAELDRIQRKITQKEAELMEITPDLQDRIKQEKDERRR